MYSKPSKAVKCILVALESIIFGITPCSTASYRLDFLIGSLRSAHGQSLIYQLHTLVQKSPARKFTDRIARFSPQRPGSKLPCFPAKGHPHRIPEGLAAYTQGVPRLT